MGIFRHDLTPPKRSLGTVWDDKPCVSVDLWVPGLEQQRNSQWR
jgi:hypothetical protein